jgi:hypothetical protein
LPHALCRYMHFSYNILRLLKRDRKLNQGGRSYNFSGFRSGRLLRFLLNVVHVACSSETSEQFDWGTSMTKVYSNFNYY